MMLFSKTECENQIKSRLETKTLPVFHKKSAQGMVNIFDSILYPSTGEKGYKTKSIVHLTLKTKANHEYSDFQSRRI